MKTAEFVECSQCSYWEECESKENRDGCYFGEKMEEENMNMYEELKAWADKWGVKYTEYPASEKYPFNCLYFDSMDYQEPSLEYDPKTGEYRWRGGE